MPRFGITLLAGMAMLAAGCAQLQSLRTPQGETLEERVAGLENRLDELESKLETRGQLELVSEVQSLQAEVRELRGQVQEQGHRLEALRERQRDLYADLDRRVRTLEVGRPAGEERASAAAGSGTPDAAAEQAYHSAFSLLKDGRYPQAAEAFRKFLEQHPDSRYADNAQYWLAEANYVSRDFETALKAFQAVVEQYPESPKAPDARLKIGYTYYEMEQWDKAREALQRLIEDHPDSSAAELARQRLQRMRSEGR